MALTRMTKSAASGPTKTEKPAEEKPLILYVEDDDTNWDLTNVALSERYRVVRARNAKEAFSLLSERPFDLILMDIELSGSSLNGIEITQVLKKVPSAPQPVPAPMVEVDGTPIIFVSAYSAQYSKKDLLSAGGDDLVTKPVDFTRLSLAMSRMMVRNAFSPSESSPPKKPTPPPSQERRSFERRSKVFPCSAEVGGIRYVAQAIDISPGGVKMVIDTWDAADQFAVGTEFVTSLAPIWGDAKITCTVARICEDSPYTIGARFKDISPTLRGELEAWLYD